MGVYLDKIGIKSIVAITYWFHTELIKAGKQAELECVKLEGSKGVAIFWAVNSKLHKHVMVCPTIATLHEDHINTALIEILKSLK